MQPLKDNTKLDDPLYVGNLTGILNRLGLDYDTYKATVMNKDTNYFDELPMCLPAEPPPEDLMPQVGENSGPPTYTPPLSLGLEKRKWLV